MTLSNPLELINFWDPVIHLMTGRRAEVYGRRAANDERILDYTNVCAAMYEKLPGVDRPYRATSSMATATYQPTLQSMSDPAMMAAFSFLWCLGMIHDQWAVRDLVLDHLRTWASRLSEAFTAHVINLAVDESIRAKVSVDKLKGIPTPIANEIADSMARRQR